MGRALPVEEFVYYLRRDDLVKIGYTACFTGRMRSLKPDEVLAVEPGGRSLETLRHRQFAAWRVDLGDRSREWYQPVPELLEHVEQLAALHPVPLRRPPVPAPAFTIEELLAAVQQMSEDQLITLGKLLVDPRARQRDATQELFKRGWSLERMAIAFGVDPATAWRWMQAPSQRRPGQRKSKQV